MSEKYYQCRNPVLLRVYARPNKTKAVIEILRKVRPSRLYVSGDGPRNDADFKNVSETRNLIDTIDWPCDIKTKFWDKNVGGPVAGYEGISWFFSHELRGVILEDDTLPSIDFFRFCDELLDKYENNDRIFHITGNNFQCGIPRSEASYYFSKYSHNWGWASWARAWQRCDLRINFWPKYKISPNWLALCSDKVERKYWEKIFDSLYQQKNVHWDYAWQASCWFYEGLTATPNRNLVSNIGFGAGASNTTNPNSPLANMPTAAIGEVRHPAAITQHAVADRYDFDHNFGGKNQRFPWSLLHLPRRIGGFVYRKLKRGFA